MGTKLMAFCMPGGHAVEVDDIGPDRVPEGWALCEADVLPPPDRGPDAPYSPGIWYARSDTGCWILCCPEHPLIEV